MAQMWADDDKQRETKGFELMMDKIVENHDSMVNHPKHYNLGKHECIDEMIAMFGVEQVKAFCRCNVYKYRYRAEAKNGQEDRDKAEFYMDYLIKLESES